MPAHGSIELQRGWKEYFLSRGRQTDGGNGVVDRGLQLVKYAHSDMSLVDCLSFPISVAHFLHAGRLGLDWTNPVEKLTIICIGCSEKAEERVLRETNAFLELLYALPCIHQIDVWLVGPEISATCDPLQEHTSSSTSQATHRIRFSLFKGGAMDFFRSHPQCLSAGSLVVGYNCGFGNFENPLPRRYDLFLSWLPDLLFLCSTTLPLVFFCANDYADLRGEAAVMAMLGAHFISAPAENPFAFASTMIPPGASASAECEEYARGNAFYYAVQGSDRQRRLPALRIKGPFGQDIVPVLAPYLTKAKLASSITQAQSLLVQGRLQLTPLTPVSSLLVPPPAAPPAAPVAVLAATSSPAPVPVILSAAATAAPAPPASMPTPLAVCQRIQGTLLVLEITNQKPHVDLKSATLDVHSSGTYLRLRIGTGVDMQIPLQSTVSPLSSAVCATYSRKRGCLTVQLPLQAADL